MSFKQAMADDVDVFLNPGEFGLSAVFSSTGKTVPVLLDKEQEVETGRIIDVMTVRVSDVDGIAVGDTFTIGSEVYRNESKFPEPLGELMCMLRVAK